MAKLLSFIHLEAIHHSGLLAAVRRTYRRVDVCRRHDACGVPFALSVASTASTSGQDGLEFARTV